MLSDWSKTIVYCAGKLVPTSFKDYSSYGEFTEKINLYHIMHNFFFSKGSVLVVIMIAL